MLWMPELSRRLSPWHRAILLRLQLDTDSTGIIRIRSRFPVQIEKTRRSMVLYYYHTSPQQEPTVELFEVDENETTGFQSCKQL